MSFHPAMERVAPATEKAAPASPADVFISGNERAIMGSTDDTEVRLCQDKIGEAIKAGDVDALRYWNCRLMESHMAADIATGGSA